MAHKSRLPATLCVVAAGVVAACEASGGVAGRVFSRARRDDLSRTEMPLLCSQPDLLAGIDTCAERSLPIYHASPEHATALAASGKLDAIRAARGQMGQ